jgi:hypothetical protein
MRPPSPQGATSLTLNMTLLSKKPLNPRHPP